MDSLSILNGRQIIPSTQNNGGQSVEERAKERAQEQQDDFLQLLITQLETQNPLDPMKTDEFAAQLTRFSQLEQQIESNEKMAITNDLLKDSAAAASFSYIGKEAEISSNIGVVQDGETKWSYTIDGTAEDVALTVVDEEGNIVFEDQGKTAPGAHDLTLEATSAAMEGQQLFLNIAAKDTNGNKLNTQTTSHVKVDGLWSDDQQSYLTAGDISFRTSDILQVQKPSPLTATQPQDENI